MREEIIKIEQICQEAIQPSVEKIGGKEFLTIKSLIDCEIQPYEQNIFIPTGCRIYLNPNYVMHYRQYPSNLLTFDGTTKDMMVSKEGGEISTLCFKNCNFQKINICYGQNLAYLCIHEKPYVKTD
jgi:hypothetical protein